MTLRELLVDLRSRGIVTAVAESGVDPFERHVRVSAGRRAPWYLTTMSALGAWIATLFLLGALSALLQGLVRAAFPAWTVAAVLALTAGRLVAGRWSTRLSAHVALAMAFSGAGMLFVALSELGRDLAFLAPATAVVYSILYALHRELAFRVCAAFFAAFLFVLWSLEDPVGGVANLFLQLTALCACSMPRARKTLAPVGLALAGSLGFYFLYLHAVPLQGPWWPSTLFVTLALLAVTGQAIRLGASLTDRPVLVVTLPAAIVFLGLLFRESNPGLLYALVVLVLGRSSARVGLTVLGLVALPVFLTAFVVDLEGTLRSKAALLVSMGAGLLALRAILGLRFGHTESRP